MDKRYTDLDIVAINIGPNGELKFSVGQIAYIQLKGQEDKGKQPIKITKIIRDEANHFYFGRVAWAIYAEFNGIEFCWQSVEGVPVRLIYNISYDEVHNNSGQGVSNSRNGQEEKEETNRD